MKREIFRLTSATIIFLVATVAAADDFSQYRSVCELRVRTGNDIMTGSGTLIAVNHTRNDALVLTCRHVGARGQIMANWKWATGGVVQRHAYPLAVLPGDDFDTDLAVLYVPQFYHPSGRRPAHAYPSPVPVAAVSRQDGPWVGVGFRDGKMRVTPRVSSLEIIEGGLLKLPTPFVRGQSGGPVFNRYGQLIGVVVASDFKTTGLAADGDHLRNLLRKFVGTR